MYYALRCTYDNTEEVFNWVREVVGGPDEELHVSCPRYLRKRRVRRDCIVEQPRHLLPGLIFVRQWARGVVKEQMSECPDRYLRWMADNDGSLLVASLPDILDLEEAALAQSRLQSQYCVDGLFASESVRMTIGPFSSLPGEVVSEHRQGFVEPYYMVRWPELRCSIKVDGFLLERV